MKHTLSHISLLTALVLLTASFAIQTLRLKTVQAEIGEERAKIYLLEENATPFARHWAEINLTITGLSYNETRILAILRVEDNTPFADGTTPNGESWVGNDLP